MPSIPIAPRRGRSALVPCLLLPLTLAVPSLASETPATVIIGGRTVPFSVTPYVGNDGQVYAPVDAVRLMGASFTVNSNAYTVTVTGVNGRQVTAPFIPRQGHQMVALQKVAQPLGASADWQPTTQTLTLRARLEMVRQNPDSLLIVTSYPVAYQVQHIGQPSRVYVDLYGLDLAAAPASVPVVDGEGPGANVLRIRDGQINMNTVRVTIDLKRDMGYQVVTGPQSDRIKVALGGAAQPVPTVFAATPPEGWPAPTRTLPPLPVSGLPTRPLAPPTRTVVNPPRPVLPVVPPSQGVRITSVSVRSVSDTLTQIAVTATGQAKYRTETLDNPNRLAFDLAGAEVAEDVSPQLPGAGPVIKAVRAGILRTDVTQFGRVVVDLTRLVAYTVTRQVAGDGAVTYLINLQTPRQAALRGGNSLSGKIVVIDPGHGLQDSGSLGLDGTCEKDMTLAIGRKLRDALVENGATVYMTRADDAFLPVNARPQFAVAHQADYFISVHCDSIGREHTATSHTGSTVYFHAQNGLCRRMAEDIINRVSEVSGLPSDGVKSDTIRFQTGFGVLRGSPMPAVLVECGYMNNDADLAKLKDPDTQQHIAEGIVAGLRDFIADRAAQ